MAVAKQRVEITAHPVEVAALAGGTAPAAAVQAVMVPVDEVVNGAITVWDRMKAYYHTIFAAISAVAVLIIEFGPDLGRVPLIPDSVRHWITLAIVVANVIVTRGKSNEVWVPASPQPPRSTRVAD